VAVEVVGHERPGAALGVGALLPQPGDLAGGVEFAMLYFTLPIENSIELLVHLI